MNSIKNFEGKILQYTSPFNWGEMKKVVSVNSYANEKKVIIFIDHLKTGMHYRFSFELEKENIILVSDYFESKRGCSATFSMQEEEVNSLNKIRSKVKELLTMAIQDILGDVKEEIIFTSWSNYLPFSYKELNPFDVIKNGSKSYFLFNIDKSPNKEFYYKRYKQLNEMKKMKQEQKEASAIIIGFEYAPYFVQKLLNKRDGDYIFEFENGDFLN